MTQFFMFSEAELDVSNFRVKIILVFGYIYEKFNLKRNNNKLSRDNS